VVTGRTDIDFFVIYSLGLGKQWEIPDEIFHPSDEEKANESPFEKKWILKETIWPYPI
jgi:hypothetical protein